MTALWTWLKAKTKDSVILLFIAAMVSGYGILGTLVLVVEGHPITAAVMVFVSMAAMLVSAAVASNLESLLEKLRTLTTPAPSATAPKVPPALRLAERASRGDDTPREPIGSKDRPPMRLKPERLRLLQPAITSEESEKKAA